MFEDGPLFDVQFEVRGGVPQFRAGVRGIREGDSDAAQGVFEAHAVAVFQFAHLGHVEFAA